MTFQDGFPLPHLTPNASPLSFGVNSFAQDLSSGAPFLEHQYVFPPLSLVGPVLRFLKAHQRSCSAFVLDVYPKKHWWPLIQNCARKSCRLAVKGMLEPFYLLLNKDGFLMRGSLGFCYVFSNSAVWMNLNDRLWKIVFVELCYFQNTAQKNCTIMFLTESYFGYLCY